MEDKVPLIAPDKRTIIVGDDTGLIKKVKMTLVEDTEIVSMPDKKRRRNKRTKEDAEAEEGKDHVSE